MLGDPAWDISRLAHTTIPSDGVFLLFSVLAFLSYSQVVLVAWGVFQVPVSFFIISYINSEK